MNEKIIFIKNIDSTNEYAKNNLTQFKDTTLIIAETQSKGKGRFNRTWISDLVGNLYCSIIQKNSIFLKHPTQLPIVVAVIIKRLISVLIQKEAENVFFKWPNDIYSKQGKIGGILIEKDMDTYIIGVGLNVISFPIIEGVKTSSISKITNTYMFPFPEGMAEILLSIYEEAILEYKAEGFNVFKNEWESSCMHLNKKIVLNETINDEKKILRKLIFLGINDDGSARVKELDEKDIESDIYYGEIDV